jgi:hypothetical protein
MDKKNLIIKLFKSLRGEKESLYILIEGYDSFPNFLSPGIFLLLSSVETQMEII